VTAGVAYGPLVGALTGLVLAVAGPIATRLVRSWTAWQVAGLIAAAALLVSAGVAVMEIVSSGLGASGYVDRSVSEVVRAIAPVAAAQGLKVSAAEQAKLVQLGLYALLPAMTLLMSVLAGLVSVKVVTWVGQRSGESVRTLPSLPELDLSWHFVWLVIAALAVGATDAFLHFRYVWLEILGVYLLLPARVLMYAQGMGVFSWLYRRAHMSGVMRTVNYVLLTVVELAGLPVVGLVGVADLWLNFRGLPRIGTVPQAPTDGGARF
jgi:uncharacterized protein YybS (DUF2232 family)